MSARILVTGARDWTDEESVHEALDDARDEFGSDAVLVVGDCPRGVDKIAYEYWVDGGGIAECFIADWDKHGRGAGMIRNNAMVSSGADVCLAFITPKSRGTRHCAKQARKKGVEVRLWVED